MHYLTRTALASLLCLAPLWAQSAFPPPDSSNNPRRPNIGYNFGQPVRDMRLLIDGRDMTSAATKSGNVINIMPNYDIDLGQHQVQAQALNILGLPVGQTWRFTVGSPNGSVQNPNSQPQTPVRLSPTRVTPANDSVVSETRPRIALEYPDTIRQARFWLNGQEVTDRVSLSGSNLSFSPVEDLSAGRQQLASEVTYLSGRSHSFSWSFEVRPAANSDTNQPFHHLSPPPEARLRNLRPYISADYPPGLAEVRLLVDNTDLSNQSERSQSRIAWNPSYDLAGGNHVVRVEGRRSNGQLLSQTWTFVIEANAVQTPNQPEPQATPDEPAMIDFGVDEPETGDKVRQSFSIVGHGPPGYGVRVAVKPLPRRNKVAQFKGRVDAEGNFSVLVKSPSWSAKGTRLEATVTLVDKQGNRMADPIVVELFRR